MTPRTKLPRKIIAAYAGPALPLAAMYFPVFIFLAEFYAREFGLSLATLGVVLLGVRVFDALSDPVIGHISDRSRKVGRRKIWLVAATPVVMLSCWMLFAPPDNVGIAWFSLWLFLLTVGWTLAMTPYFSWGAELSGDYSERSVITFWREAVSLIGTILAALLYGIGGPPADGLRLIAIMIVLTLPVAVAVAWRVVPEPIDYSKTRPEMSQFTSVFRRLPVFRRLLLAYFLNGLANGIAATLFVFFVSYRLATPDMAGPLLVVYFGAAVLGAPLWSWLVGRYSKHRVWSWAMIYAGFIFVWTLTLGAGDWHLFAVICVLSGLALSADLALPSAIQADLVDVATVDTGAQQTGAYFAIWSVATKLALALSGAFALIYLDVVGFDVASPEPQAPLLAMALLYGLGPIILKAVAVWLMWDFPVDRREQAQLRAKIEA